MKNTNCKVRTATREDLSLMFKWGEKMHKVEKQYYPLLKYSRKESKNRYTKQLANPLCLFLIAELDEKPVGYLYAHLNKIDYLATSKYQCEIDAIYIDSSARGLGLATKLIFKAKNWAKGKNAFEIKAGIFAQNTASRMLFEEAGFELLHTTYAIKL